MNWEGRNFKWKRQGGVGWGGVGWGGEWRFRVEPPNLGPRFEPPSALKMKLDML